MLASLASAVLAPFALGTAEATAPPGTPGAGTWVLLVVAALGGGALPLLVNAWRRKGRPLDDEEAIGRIVSGEIGDLKALLAEYRVETELTKRQLLDYRDQLGEMTRELARAQVRISHLEEELRTVREGREKLQGELARLVAQRDELAAERERLRSEADVLRHRLDRLEAFASEVQDRPPATE